MGSDISEYFAGHQRLLTMARSVCLTYWSMNVWRVTVAPMWARRRGP